MKKFSNDGFQIRNVRDRMLFHRLPKPVEAILPPTNACVCVCVCVCFVAVVLLFCNHFAGADLCVLCGGGIDSHLDNVEDRSRGGQLGQLAIHSQVRH